MLFDAHLYLCHYIIHQFCNGKLEALLLVASVDLGDELADESYHLCVGGVFQDLPQFMIMLKLEGLWTNYYVVSFHLLVEGVYSLEELDQENSLDLLN